MEQGHEGFGISPLWMSVVGGLSVAVLDRTEELDGLVDQVGAEVVEYAAAVRQGGSVPPVPESFRPPPLEPRLECADFAQRSFPDEFPERQEVGVPSAVLEHRQMHTGVGCLGDKRLALCRCGDERLIHHHRKTMRYCRCCQIEVRERGVPRTMRSRSAARMNMASAVGTIRAFG